MDSKLLKLYKQLKKDGLTPRQEEKIQLELNDTGSHGLPGDDLPGTAKDGSALTFRKIYAYHDLLDLQGMTAMRSTPNVSIRSIDELLERDNQREKDGFPRKINVGRLIKPGKSGKDKVVIVPSTVEEKFIHDPSLQTDEDQSSGGSGDGEEGEVIGEQPIRAPEGEGGEGPGQGEGGQHEIESNAYDLGKILTEQFELPNVKDKGKKRSLTRYTYDLTDKNRGFGQLLDKKATLRKIVETNINLGRLSDVGNIDPSHFLISPSDLIYRILSRERTMSPRPWFFSCGIIPAPWPENPRPWWSPSMS